MSRDWMSVAELAAELGMSKRGVRKMLNRLERAHRVRLGELRPVNGKRILGASAEALQDALRRDTGEAPLAPEVEELRECLEAQQAVIARLSRAVARLAAERGIDV